MISVVEREERFRIIGVDCPTCVYSIKRIVERLKGIYRFDVDVSTGYATVVFNPDDCSLNDVYRAVLDSGYDVDKQVLILYVENIDEYGESAVEAIATKCPGVFDAKASSITRLLKITFNPESLKGGELVDLLAERGLRVKPARSIAKSTEAGYTRLLYRRILAFTFGLTAVALSTLHHFLGIRAPQHFLTALSTIVLILIYDVIHRGYRMLIKLKPTMESFVALSITISYTAGALSLIKPLTGASVDATAFFEASAGVGGFVSFGLFLEERLRSKALKQIEDLAERLHGKARVVKSGVVLEVDAHEVKRGDVVEVRAGEVIPVDGVVIEGWGYVDESSFTGEAEPRLKKGESRDPVLAGSILVNGFIKVRATRVGNDTVLFHVVETVKTAQLHKPRVLGVADRLVGLFTWLVILLGLVTALYWGLVKGSHGLAALFTATLFVAACPCALGIAIPLVASFSIIKAAKMGLLIKRGDVFERVREAKVVLFDKTGTLTEGKPVVKAVYTAGEWRVEELLSYVCSVESRSEHVLAKAILNHCFENGVAFPEPSFFENTPGMGVVGVVNGRRVAVGNVELIKGLGGVLNDNLEVVVSQIASRGSTPILVSIDGSTVGTIELSDSLRKDAPYVVDELKRRGFKVGVVSGDHRVVVEHYARLLGLELVYYELKPLDKLMVVRELEDAGLKAIFVGDGVNDAPALSRAHVGVAMGKGVDVAKVAGDVVLMEGSLKGILRWIELSRVVRRKFLENLAWAFVYNMILIPVAMGLLYEPYGLALEPEHAALAMVLSDVSVVVNAASVLAARKG